MEWWVVLLVFICGLFILMATGLPIAYCFLLISMAVMFMLWGGAIGLEQLGRNLFRSAANFVLLPIAMFIFMGEIMFHSGIAPMMIDNLDKLMGRLAGRLGLLAVGAGTVLSTLTGSSIGSVAILGEVLVPEMERRGYAKPMSLGPILGSGGLAIMVPPSALAIVVGAVAEVSIGRLLMAIIVPGLLMAAFYATYIILRCYFQPSIAPAYEVSRVPLVDKFIGFVRYVLPVGLVIFSVTGVIVLGIATPSEAGATGTLGCVVLAALYGRLNWSRLKKSLVSSMTTTGMVFLIIITAISFSQILAFSGGSRGLAQFAMGLPLSPIVIVIAMHIVGLLLGMIMGPIGIIMVTLPMFVPVLNALGFNLIWFGAMYLLNMEMAVTSPPFGMCLFVMKGVAPPGTTMGDCYRAALPFLGCDLIIIVLMLIFPQLALWLPSMMRGGV